MTTTPTNEVAAVLAGYPPAARRRLKALRRLVVAVAKETDQALTETLKWSEPSYLTKHGSTLRMAWSPKRPDNVSLFFHCQSRLVETFREIYPDLFEYDGNRAIHLPMEGPLEESALKHCMAMTLNYHRLKHLPLLGA